MVAIETDCFSRLCHNIDVQLVRDKQYFDNGDCINAFNSYIVLLMSCFGYKSSAFYNDWAINPCFVASSCHILALFTEHTTDNLSKVFTEHTTVNLSKTYSYMKLI